MTKSYPSVVRSISRRFAGGLPFFGRGVEGLIPEKETGSTNWCPGLICDQVLLVKVNSGRGGGAEGTGVNHFCRFPSVACLQLQPGPCLLIDVCAGGGGGL